MKIAVISDIHSNYYALRSVISEISFCKCDKIVFCGDVLGYYYDSEKCINYLRENKILSVLGNHDRMFFEKDKWNYYILKYGTSLAEAKRNLTEKNEKWLKSLNEIEKIELNGFAVIVSHGTPKDRSMYLYPDVSDVTLKNQFDMMGDIFLIGHSHYQFHKKFGNKHVINPGSVGQPRDKGQCAKWIILDLKKEINVIFKSSYYDVTKLENEAKIKDPNIPYLWEVLRRNS